MPVMSSRPEHQLDAGHDGGDRLRRADLRGPGRSTSRRRPASPRRRRTNTAPSTMAAIRATTSTASARAELDDQALAGGEHLDPHRLAAARRRPAARRSIMSSSWLGSWWNSASRLAPTSPASHTAYSTVQWPQSHFLANSAGVYWASWISRSTPWHSSHTPSAMRAPPTRLLVVADVGDARAAVRDAVAERLADVGHGARSRRRSRRCGTWRPARGRRRGRGSRRARSGTAAGRSSPRAPRRPCGRRRCDGRVDDELGCPRAAAA